jgi:hypothetical protein
LALQDYQAAILARATRDDLPAGGGYDPTQVQLINKVAALYEAQGDRQNALRQYEAALLLDRDDATALSGRDRLSAQ